MAASYPAGTPNLPEQQTDGVSTVNAGDVNPVYDELKAVTDTLGTNPHKRSSAWSSNSYSTASTDFATVGDRIKNVEDGVQVITGSAVTSAGNKTVTVVSDTHIGLTMKAKSGQTANLMEFRPSGSDTPSTAINSAGYIVVIDGGTA